MTFAENIKAMKGVEARNAIPSCDSIEDLERVLAIETRKIVTGAVEGRIRKLRADALRAEVEGVRPEVEEDEELPPVEKVIPSESTQACTRCGLSGDVAERFGFRTMTRHRVDGTVIKTRRAQSQCKACRGRNTKGPTPSTAA